MSRLFLVSTQVDKTKFNWTIKAVNIKKVPVSLERKDQASDNGIVVNL